MTMSIPAKKIDVVQMRQRVDELFGEGYCCSEAIALVISEYYSPHISTDLIHAATTGLCGGMGGKQGSCGVFTGGAVALGLVLGKGIKRDKHIKSLSAEYLHQLEKKAGAQICHQLLSRMGIKNWNGSGCRQLTQDGVELLHSILEQDGICPVTGPNRRSDLC